MQLNCEVNSSKAVARSAITHVSKISGDARELFTSIIAKSCYIAVIETALQYRKIHVQKHSTFVDKLIVNVLQLRARAVHVCMCGVY